MHFSVWIFSFLVVVVVAPKVESRRKDRITRVNASGNPWEINPMFQRLAAPQKQIRVSEIKRNNYTLNI